MEETIAKSTFKGMVNGVSFDNQEEFNKAVEEAIKKGSYNIACSYYNQNDPDDEQVSSENKAPSSRYEYYIKNIANLVSEYIIRDLTNGLSVAELEKINGDLISNHMKWFIDIKTNSITSMVLEYLEDIYCNNISTVSSTEQLINDTLPRVLDKIISDINLHIAEVDRVINNVQKHLRIAQKEYKEFEFRSTTDQESFCNLKSYYLLSEDLKRNVNMSRNILDITYEYKMLEILKALYINIQKQTTIEFTELKTKK